MYIHVDITEQTAKLPKIELDGGSVFSFIFQHGELHGNHQFQSVSDNTNRKTFYYQFM